MSSRDSFYQSRYTRLILPTGRKSQANNERVDKAYRMLSQPDHRIRGMKQRRHDEICICPWREERKKRTRGHEKKGKKFTSFITIYHRAYSWTAVLSNSTIDTCKFSYTLTNNNKTKKNPFPTILIDRRNLISLAVVINVYSSICSKIKKKNSDVDKASTCKNDLCPGIRSQDIFTFILLEK